MGRETPFSLVLRCVPLFVAGLILLLGRPIKLGDRVVIGDTVVKWSYGDQRVRIDIDAGVSCGSGLDTVLRSLLEVAEEHPQVLSEVNCAVFRVAARN